MVFLTQFSPAHEVLYREWFSRTIPSGTTVIVNELNLTGSGTFYSKEWQQAMTEKLRFVISEAQSRCGELLVWADADIQFFPSFSLIEMEKGYRESGKLFLFQKETRFADREVNCGLYVFTATVEAIGFLQRALSIQEKHERQNDQVTINELLHQPGGPSWDVLPLSYYARSHGFPPPRKILLHHANYTTVGGVEVKIRQFRRVRAMVLGSYARYLCELLIESLSNLHRIPNRLRLIGTEPKRAPIQAGEPLESGHIEGFDDKLR